MTYFLRFSLPYILQNHSPDPFQLLPGLAAAFHREDTQDTSFKRRRSLIVDVGAWAGDVSAQLLQMFTDLERRRYHGDDYDRAVPAVIRRREVLAVLAFEPDPETFQLLAARAEAHQWARAGFCAVEAAMSHSVRGPQHFRARRGFSQDSQLEEENEGLDEELNAEPLVSVDVLSLDAWLLNGDADARRGLACARLPPLHLEGEDEGGNRFDAEVFLLKVDAQGHDDQVLRGARRLLSAGLVRFVIFEYGGHGAVPSEDRSLWATVSFLWDHGMACFLVFEQLLVPVSGPWWMDPYDAAGAAYLGLQSSDLFCGGVHDPGLQLIIEIFVGSRYAPRAKEFVTQALKELRGIYKNKVPGQSLVAPSVNVVRREHIARIAAGYWDLVAISRDLAVAKVEFGTMQRSDGQDGAEDNLRNMRMRACLELGDLFAHGYGALVNYSAAREWFSRAASEGSSDALVNLGILNHFHGRGTIERRRRLGGEFYLKASEVGHAFAGLMSLPVFA